MDLFTNLSIINLLPESRGKNINVPLSGHSNYNSQKHQCKVLVIKY